MVAHGYGIAATGIPNLIFSNVLWGYLVRAIPEVNGTLGYSTATLGALVTVGAVMFYGLNRLGAGYVASLLILALVLVRPVLLPQFTINSGLLMVGAIICWHLFIRQNNWKVLWLGCLLAFSSYLVRSQESMLVFAVALPVLRWRILLVRRSSQAAVLALASAITVAAVIDHQAYQGDEWKAFNELNITRALFTDFGAGEHLKKRPDILSRYGYSANDIDLITGWFFVDSQIANPASLQAMLSELGALPTQEGSLVKAWLGVKGLWHPNLLPLLLTALLLAALRPSWRVAAIWGLVITAVFIIGFVGRPGALRVYVPLVSLLVVAPYLVATQTPAWRKSIGASALAVAVTLNAYPVFSESKALQISAEQTRKGLENFPTNPIVTWGGGFPLEAVSPVLHTPSSTLSYQLYSLGVFTLAPFAVSYDEQKQGRGLVEFSLVTEKGVPIYNIGQHLGQLEIYCGEHLHGQLRELSNQRYGEGIMSQLRCERKP